MGQCANQYCWNNPAIPHFGELRTLQYGSKEMLAHLKRFQFSPAYDIQHCLPHFSLLLPFLVFENQIFILHQPTWLSPLFWQVSRIIAHCNVSGWVDIGLESTPVIKQDLKSVDDDVDNYNDNDEEYRRLARHSPRAKANIAKACNTMQWSHKIS